MKISGQNVLIAVGVLLAITGGGVIYVKARGIRNNNPGNIRYNPANDWLGQVGQDDAGYAIFDTPENGIRALGKLLTNYFTRYGLDSVRSIIYRWAPPSDDNPTENYISHVVDFMNRDHVVKITDNTPIYVPHRLLELSKAIIKHENGLIPPTWSDEFIGEALALA